MLDPQLRAQLKQTIYVASRLGGLDEYGNPAYSTPKECRARIRDLQKLITDSKGQQVVAAVELLTDTPIGIQDRIWLPGADVTNPNQAQVPKNRQNLLGERGEYVATRVWL
jgi:hypothetical protein